MQTYKKTAHHPSMGFRFSARFIPLNHPVPEADDAGAALNHAFVVGDKNKGAALGVEVVKKTKNFLPGFAVEIPRGFIGKNDERAV
jgi:hypothetical protein